MNLIHVQAVRDAIERLNRAEDHLDMGKGGADAEFLSAFVALAKLIVFAAEEQPK